MHVGLLCLSGKRCCSHLCANNRPRRNPGPRFTLEERFWSKVQKTESCWLWTGAKNAKGYGFLGATHGEKYAHRLSWIFANGPIPDGLWVLHNCPGGDNSSCVNPAHLWLGDARDNNWDTIIKGRGRWCPK